jgi:predicted ATPase/class 3 adenylate cyclase
MNEIPEIKQLKIISENQRSRVYLADGDNGQQMLIKEDVSGDLSRLHNEVFISSSLKEGHFDSRMMLYNGNVVLLRNYVSGKTLKELIPEGGMELKDFLKFSVQLATVLQNLHQQFVLHHDINPKNIIFDNEDKCHLIDFEFSSMLNSIEISYEQAQTIKGTVEYMSPEQTGRMNRKMDYRSDFYSLGVTFYEMITGKLPFENEDVLEMVHCHLALYPQNPSDIKASVPKAIDAIILKLLSKNAEDRYQSLQGLLIDLNLCLKHLEKSGTIPEFEVGTTDVASKLTISQKLYGREKEIEKLIESFDLACQNKKVLVTIGGYSGTGKSMLCFELHRFISLKNGFFLSGNFDALDKQTPYLAWIKAFRQFADWLIAQPEKVQKSWADKFQRELKGLGNIIIDLVPNLGYILPQQPELVDLSGFENQQRVQYTFNAFIKCLATSETPLVFFLDDFQWADEASFELLKSLFNNYSLSNLLILITYRDNETNEFHPFSKTIQNIKSSHSEENLLIEEIKLAPLKQEHVSELLSDTLRMGNIEVSLLSELVYSKTKGNAFALTKLLESLYRQKLLHFDYEGKTWKWDLAKIANHNISDNIIDLLLYTIKELDEEALKMVKIAAVLGFEFSLEQVSSISGKSASAIHRDFWPLIKDMSILPVGNDYHYLPEYYEQTNKDVRFKFAHPRIQQAVYDLLDEGEKSIFHFNLGLIYLKKQQETYVEIGIIDMARHFSIGFAHVLSSEDKFQIGRILLAAGRMAAQAASFEVALGFTENALLCLKDDLSRKDKFKILVKLLEYSFLIKNEPRQREYRKAAMSLADTLPERLLVYENLIRGLDYGNHPQEAVQLARTALLEVGISIPEKAKKWQIIYQAIKLQIFLPSSKFGQIANLPLVEDELVKSIFRVLMVSLPPYFFVNIDTYPILIFKMIELTLKKGCAPESSPGFASYGLILSGAMKKPVDGYQVVKESFKLLSIKGAEKYAATNMMVDISFTSFVKENIRDKIAMCQEGFQKGVVAGNMEYASWNLLFGFLIKFDLGCDFLKLTKEAKEVGNFQKQYNFRNQEAINICTFKALKMMTVDPQYLEVELQKFNETKDEYYASAIKEKNDVYLYSYFGVGAIVNLWYGKYHQAYDLFENYWSYAQHQVPTYFIHSYNFYRLLNASLLVLQSGDNSYKGKNLVKFIKNGIKVFKQSAKLNPVTCQPLWMFLQGQLDLITTGKVNHQNFEQSIQMLEEFGNIKLEVLFCEIYSDHIKTIDKTKYEYYRNRAIIKSKEMNTFSKSFLLMSDLESQKPVTVKDKTSSRGSSTSSLELSTIDTKTLIKTMQALITEIKVESLLEKLLTYAMENTGAQEGHFIINRNGDWVVEVSTTANHSLHTSFPRTRLQESKVVSQAILNFTRKTKEPLVLSNASTMKPFDIDEVVKAKNIQSVLCIPFINQSKISGIIYLTHSVTSEAFKEEHVSLMRLMAGQIGAIIENALLYENMENLVKERTYQLEQEKHKSENLLLNILPKEVAQELLEKGKASARLYESVSVMFIDIMGFTQIADKMTPDDLVKNLDRIFSGFDSITTEFRLEKIKTIGDAYMVAGGIPIASADHLERIILAAFVIKDFVRDYNEERRSRGEVCFEIRIGIHIGPVVAGVVGDRKFAYDIWGDTVNIAARMEENSKEGKINVSEHTYKLISETFDCEYRGEIPVKNKGNMKMYFVNGKLKT